MIGFNTPGGRARRILRLKMLVPASHTNSDLFNWLSFSSTLKNSARLTEYDP